MPTSWCPQFRVICGTAKNSIPCLLARENRRPLPRSGISVAELGTASQSRRFVEPYIEYPIAENVAITEFLGKPAHVRPEAARLE